MFSSIDAALAALARGRPVIVSDSESRENEGDFILPAAVATPELIGFINRYSSGVICAPMLKARAQRLDLPPMVANNTDPKNTAFTISVDAIHETTTGISAVDRATTLRALSHPQAEPNWFSRPGHIFPLVGRPGGVFERDGHTEATLDLCRLAGAGDTGMLVEIMNDDGTMTQRDALALFARQHKLEFITIEALRAYRLGSEPVAQIDSDTRINRPDGTWRRIEATGVPGLPNVTALIRGPVENGIHLRFGSISTGISLPGFDAGEGQNCLSANIRALRKFGSAALIMTHDSDDDAPGDIAFSVGLSLLKEINPRLESISLSQDRYLSHARARDVDIVAETATHDPTCAQDVALPW